MDDFGFAQTNDPHVRVLWEREGRLVRMAFEVAPEPQHSPPSSLPPGCSREE